MREILVTKTMYTETAHRLVDYPQGRCQHLHGHSYKWEVTVAMINKDNDGLDSRGMVLDFKDLKQVMMEYIDKYDHALILCKDDPLVEMCSKDPLFSKGGLGYFLRSTAGKDPRLFVMSFNPTAENLVNFVAKELNDAMLLLGAYVKSVTVWETSSSSATWVSD